MVYDYRMNRTLIKVYELAGSYQKIGDWCGVSKNAVAKWFRVGYLPRTEHTGETSHAATISAAIAREHGVFISPDKLRERPKNAAPARG